MNETLSRLDKDLGVPGGGAYHRVATPLPFEEGMR